MQSWPATPYAATPLPLEPSVLDSAYSTPSSESANISFVAQIATRKSRGQQSESNSTIVVEDDIEFDNRSLQNTKLKGIIWDGMGCFDAATPEMKRKRNQKKDTCVLVKLVQTSEGAQPLEYVHDRDEGGGFNLVRGRLVTGNSNEDDGGTPIAGEEHPEEDGSPTKPKRKTAPRKPRPALAERNVNNNRRGTRRRESHHPPFGTDARRGPYFDGGVEEDDELTYGRPGPAPAPAAARRNGVSIHRDNSGPDITFDNPPAMNTLTSGFRPQFQPPPLPQNQSSMSQNGNMARVPHQGQPSFPFTAGFRPNSNHQLSGSVPPPNIGSFGHFTGQPLFGGTTNFNVPNPFTMATGGPNSLSNFSTFPSLGPPPPFDTAAFFGSQNQTPIPTA